MSRGPLLFAVQFPLLALSTLFVALRFYSRHFIVRSLGLDDWVMLVALLNAWAVGIINVFHVKYGSGQHMMDLDLTGEFYVHTLQVWYVYQLEYLITLFFIKISILAFYRRLSPAQGYQTSIKIVAACVIIYTISTVLVNAFECPKNPSLAWAPTFPQGCNDLVSVYYAQAGFNILSDFVILVLPLPSVLRLQVNKRKRVALIVVFSIGSVAVIASIVRINALYIFQHTVDPSYDGILILLWSQVEINVAIISASAPGVRPIMKYIAGGITTTGKSRSYTYPVLHGSNSRRIALQSLGKTGRAEEAKASVTGGRPTGEVVNESQENIVTKTGIMGTTDVRVETVPDGRSESLKDVECGHGHGHGG